MAKQVGLLSGVAIVLLVASGFASAFQQTDLWKRPDQWGRLKQGQTEAEVQQILGEPTSRGGGEDAMVWFYADGSAIGMVSFSGKPGAWQFQSAVAPKFRPERGVTDRPGTQPAGPEAVGPPTGPPAPSDKQQRERLADEYRQTKRELEKLAKALGPDAEAELEDLLKAPRRWPPADPVEHGITILPQMRSLRESFQQRLEEASAKAAAEDAGRFYAAETILAVGDEVTSGGWLQVESIEDWTANESGDICARVYINQNERRSAVLFRKSGETEWRVIARTGQPKPPADAQNAEEWEQPDCLGISEDGRVAVIDRPRGGPFESFRSLHIGQPDSLRHAVTTGVLLSEQPPIRLVNLANTDVWSSGFVTAFVRDLSGRGRNALVELAGAGPRLVLEPGQLVPGIEPPMKLDILDSLAKGTGEGDVLLLASIYDAGLHEAGNQSIQALLSGDGHTWQVLAVAAKLSDADRIPHAWRDLPAFSSIGSIVGTSGEEVIVQAETETVDYTDRRGTRYLGRSQRQFVALSPEARARVLGTIPDELTLPGGRKAKMAGDANSVAFISTRYVERHGEKFGVHYLGGGQFTTLAESAEKAAGQMMPGFHFTTFELLPGIDGLALVLFKAEGQGGKRGIWAWHGGQVHNVLSTGDRITVRPVLSVDRARLLVDGGIVVGATLDGRGREQVIAVCKPKGTASAEPSP